MHPREWFANERPDSAHIHCAQTQDRMNCVPSAIELSATARARTSLACLYEHRIQRRDEEPIETDLAHRIPSRFESVLGQPPVPLHNLTLCMLEFCALGSWLRALLRSVREEGKSAEIEGRPNNTVEPTALKPADSTSSLARHMRSLWPARD